jgi:hypothetical protein
MASAPRKFHKLNVEALCARETTREDHLYV